MRRWVILLMVPALLAGGCHSWDMKWVGLYDGRFGAGGKIVHDRGLVIRAELDSKDRDFWLYRLYVLPRGDELLGPTSVRDLTPRPPAIGIGVGIGPVGVGLGSIGGRRTGTTSLEATWDQAALHERIEDCRLVAVLAKRVTPIRTDLLVVTMPMKPAPPPAPGAERKKKEKEGPAPTSRPVALDQTPHLKRALHREGIGTHARTLVLTATSPIEIEEKR